MKKQTMTSPKGRMGASIPGQSLTLAPGEAPWERPPEITDHDEVFDYYINKINDTFEKNFVPILEAGYPLTTLVTMITKLSAMKGVHSVPMGIAIRPVLHEYIRNLAEEASVEIIEDVSQLSEEDPEKSAKTLQRLLTGKKFRRMQKDFSGKDGVKKEEPISEVGSSIPQDGGDGPPQEMEEEEGLF